MIDVIIDPNEHYTGIIDREKLTEACGCIPVWVAEAMGRRAAGDGESVKDIVCGMYGFPCHPFSGVVDEEGVYNYPEDPPLNPYMKITGIGGDIVYIYQCAIIAFISKDETYVTRMD